MTQSNRDLMFVLNDSLNHYFNVRYIVYMYLSLHIYTHIRVIKLFTYVTLHSLYISKTRSRDIRENVYGFLTACVLTCPRFTSY